MSNIEHFFSSPEQVLDSKSTSSFDYIKNPTISFSVLSFHKADMEAWQSVEYTKGHVDESY